MTPEEQYQARTRELEHRLREVRSENSELKINQRRWLGMCSLISAVSLSVLILVVVTSLRPEVLLTGEINERQEAELNRVQIELKQKKTQCEKLLHRNQELEEMLSKEKLETNTPVQDQNSSLLQPPEPPIPNPTKVRVPEIPTPPVSQSLELPSVANSPATDSTSFSLPDQDSHSSSTEQNQNYVYTVKKNDTLYGLSKKFFNNYSSVSRIRIANHLQSNNLYPGQQLIIPLDD